MASPEARAILKKLQCIEGSNTCVECGTWGPQWCSVSYGTFFCLECSGVHRSLGVHLSFVKSASMDKWKDIELRKMEAGGNQKWKDFCNASDDVTPGMSIKEKYSTWTASLFRDRVSTIAEGRPWDINEARMRVPKPRPPPPPEETSRFDMPGMTPTAAGGRSSAGFGSSPAPAKESGGGSGGFFDDPLASIQSGWSIFSSKASAAAKSAAEATSAAAKSAGAKISDKTRALQEKVREGHVIDKMSAGLSSFGTKVKTAGSRGIDSMRTAIRGERPRVDAHDSMGPNEGPAGADDEYDYEADRAADEARAEAFYREENPPAYDPGEEPASRLQYSSPAPAPAAPRPVLIDLDTPSGGKGDLSDLYPSVDPVAPVPAPGPSPTASRLRAADSSPATGPGAPATPATSEDFFAQMLSPSDAAKQPITPTASSRLRVDGAGSPAPSPASSRPASAAGSRLRAGGAKESPTAANTGEKKGSGWEEW